MSLGIIERCLELCVAYAKETTRFGKPIGDHQLIQEKLARMEVHRLKHRELVFRALEKGQAASRWTSPRPRR